MEKKKESMLRVIAGLIMLGTVAALPTGIMYLLFYICAALFQMGSDIFPEPASGILAVWGGIWLAIAIVLLAIAQIED